MLKTAYVAFSSIFLPLWLARDDWNFYVGEFSKAKQVASYLMARLTLVFLDYYSKHKKGEANKVRS